VEVAQPTFRPLDLDRDREALIALLTGEEWIHRTRPVISRGEVEEEIERGDWSGEDSINLLIEVEGEVVGLVRADGLSDSGGDPQLDFRVRAVARGRGIGTAAICRITEEVFARHPARTRIEGQTRRDNVAMRRVFDRGGYVQEAVYRRGWPVAGDQPADGIGYAILRSDWESGETTPVDWD
jgi:RimJ/RimL family protein N-acetyltransferase